MRRCISLLLTMLFAIQAYSQDIHFSQFFSSPLNLNPATSGFFEGNYRLTINQKTQWRSVTVPFKTFSGGFDFPLIKRKQQRDMIGFGILFNSDKAGDSEYGTNQANISFSYMKSVSNSNNKFLSFGIASSIAQRTINYNKLTFDNMYNGDIFDPNADNGEFFTNENFLFYDLSAGIHYYHQASPNTNYSGGLAVFHLNAPKQSFLNDKNVRLKPKVNIYANSRFELSNKLDLLPGFYFANQGPYNEIMLGSSLKIEKNSDPKQYSAFTIGLYSRVVDALVVVAGLDQKNLVFLVSYDINYSKLRQASRGLGGIEFSLIYILKKGKPSKFKAVPCPIF